MSASGKARVTSPAPQRRARSSERRRRAEADRVDCVRIVQKPHLVCTVPENHDVPDVVAKPAWRFARKLTEPAAAPLGFDPAAAAGGVQLNGFYLFQSFDRPDEAARL